MSYTNDFNNILAAEDTILNATMLVFKNDHPKNMKVFPSEISDVVLKQYFKNLRAVMRDNEFVSYIPDAVSKGTLQVMSTETLELWPRMLDARNSLQNINVEGITVDNYNCSGNTILMDIEFQDHNHVYFLTIYRNVAAWYSNSIRFKKKSTGKFHQEVGEILALTPYVDVAIFGKLCYIIDEKNFNKIFKYDEVIKNQIEAHKSEILSMSFIEDIDAFMNFLNNSKRQRNAMAKVILQKRLEKIRKFKPKYIREQIEKQPELSFISYTAEHKIVIDEKSFKTVVGILCGTINLDLITKELNGIDENE